MNWAGWFLLAAETSEHGEESGATIEHGTHVFLEIFGLEVTSEVITMWAIMTLLVVFGWWASRELRKVPGPRQNVAELLMEVIIENILAPIMGRKKALEYFPFFSTLFLFILISNYSGLLPGAGIVPGFKPFTGTLGGTAGLALVVFLATHWIGIMENGFVAYSKEFFEPFFFFFPLNILEQLVRPVSLALRLYGNIFGEEALLAVLLSLAPYFVPIPIMGLDLIFGAVQAYIFTILASVYVAEAIEGGH